MNKMSSFPRPLMLILAFSIVLYASASDSDLDGHVETEYDTNKQLDQVKLFFPTSDWKTIEPDETVFAGLHYRMNIATGLKEAKLMEGNDGSEYYRLLKRWLQDRQAGKKTSNNGGFKVTKQIKVPKKTSSEKSQSKTAFSSPTANRNSVAVVAVPEQVKQETREQANESKYSEKKLNKSFMDDIMKIDNQLFNRNQNDVDQEVPSSPNVSAQNFRTYEQLKEELADIELLIDDEQNTVAKLIDQHELLRGEASMAQSLQDITDLLHNIDNAQVFLDREGLYRVVLPSLVSDSITQRVLACRLVAACVQNFPKGQVEALKAAVLENLAPLINNPGTRSAAVTALGSVVRGFPAGQSTMVDVALPQLMQSLATERNAAYTDKVYTLIGDLLQERYQEDTRVRGTQLVAVGLEKALVSQHWCLLLQQGVDTVYQQHFDARGSALAPSTDASSALESLTYPLYSSADICKGEVISSSRMLHQIAKRYQELAASDETDQDLAADYYQLFEDIVKLLKHVL